MPGQLVEVPRSMSAWCAALYDYGLLYNLDTGWQRSMQCHITVTNDRSYDGVGFHISLYEPLGGLIGAGSYNPTTAWAKLYFYQTQAGTFRYYNNYGRRRNEILNMPGYESIRDQGIEVFYSAYPDSRPKVAYVMKDDDFPPLR